MDAERTQAAAGLNETLPTSERYAVAVDGESVPVLAVEWAGGYALATAPGGVQVQITTSFDFEHAVVRPLRLDVAVQRCGPRELRFTLAGPAYVSVEFDGDIRQPLLLLIDAPELDEPPPGDGELIAFEPGRIHDVGTIELQSQQRLWIRRGAVVRGVIRAEGQHNIAIGGLGVLDGSQFERRDAARAAGRHRPRMVHLIDCQHVTVRGITILDGPTWHLVPVGCRHVEIDRVKIMNESANGDGVDVVGSQDVHIHDSFLRTLDDCIAIKALDVGSPTGHRDVERVRAERLTCWNAAWGNALEIGYETRCEHIRDIVFRDIDIIHCQWEGGASGGALTIHNGDRATVSNVLYEDIRIEDVQQKVIDFKVTFDRYSKDEQRGWLRDIGLRNVAVVAGPLPPSIIQGYRDRTVQNVTIENFTHLGRPLTNLADAKLVLERAREVGFR